MSIVLDEAKAARGLLESVKTHHKAFDLSASGPELAGLPGNGCRELTSRTVHGSALR